MRRPCFESLMESLMSLHGDASPVRRGESGRPAAAVRRLEAPGKKSARSKKTRKR